MQTLKFEPAWDKTIAPEDRIFIETFFEREIQSIYEGVYFSYLKQAVNYREHLLVTVLIHNQNDAPLRLDNEVITYEDDEHIIAKGVFSLPFTIAHRTTMPWTFIFTERNCTEKSCDYRITQM